MDSVLPADWRRPVRLGQSNTAGLMIEAANFGLYLSKAAKFKNMTFEEKILEKLRDLPAEKQREVLHFIETLKQNGDSARPLKSIRGLWKGLGVEITEDDIAQARREMWGKFPREID